MRPVPVPLLVLTTVAAGLVAAPAASAATVVVGERSNGRTVRLQPGDDLKVRVAENPSTGFTWSATLEARRDVLRSRGREYQADPAPDGSVGGGGKVTYVWRARAAGSTRLRVQLVPPGGGRADRTLHFRVRVG